jgi:hypothetical protein
MLYTAYELNKYLALSSTSPCSKKKDDTLIKKRQKPHRPTWSPTHTTLTRRAAQRNCPIQNHHHMSHREPKNLASTLTTIELSISTKIAPWSPKDTTTAGRSEAWRWIWFQRGATKGGGEWSADHSPRSSLPHKTPRQGSKATTHNQIDVHVEQLRCHIFTNSASNKGTMSKTPDLASQIWAFAQKTKTFHMGRLVWSSIEALHRHTYYSLLVVGAPLGAPPSRSGAS